MSFLKIKSLPAGTDVYGDLSSFADGLYHDGNQLVLIENGISTPWSMPIGWHKYIVDELPKGSGIDSDTLLKAIAVARDPKLIDRVVK